MTLHYEITGDDQIEYNVFLVDQQERRMSPARRAVVVGLSGLMFGLSLTLGVLWNLPSVFVLAFFMGIFLPLALLGSPLARHSVRRQTRALLDRTEFQVACGPRTTTLTPEGIRVSSAVGERFLRWAYVGFEDADSFYAIGTSPYDTVVIPKRAFATIEQQAAFLALVARYREGSVAAPARLAAPAATSTVAPPTAPVGTWWTQSGVADAESRPNRLG
jgi:hypothetical protein